MTLQEKANQYQMEHVDELLDIIMSDDRNRKFFEQRDITGTLDVVAERAIDEIMAKHPEALPSAKSSAFSKPADEPEPPKEDKPFDDTVMNLPEAYDSESTAMTPPELLESDNTDGSETSQEADIATENDSTVNTEDNSEKQPETQKSKPTARSRAKKKPVVPVEIVSEIDGVPNSLLRRFYAENFSVKPEKIFFMDDASVKEKIDEKYVVLEREMDFLFVKRTAAVVSMNKENV